MNLQRLGTLINIDLPWNPTRLEQRKGRIQRIGQARNEIWIANLRYRDSVEDRVHQVLADRLEAIHVSDSAVKLLRALPRISDWRTSSRTRPRPPMHVARCSTSAAV